MIYFNATMVRLIAYTIIHGLILSHLSESKAGHGHTRINTGVRSRGAAVAPSSCQPKPRKMFILLCLDIFRFSWFKQLYLSCIILSAAAACVSCQELTSTLRQGNYTCPGEEVTFTCTIRGPSTLSSLTLAWSSAEYISRSLQLSTTDGLGAVLISSMDGSITATATVTNSTNVAGELVLESTLRITAIVASVVTCISSADGGTERIRFFISALPGIPQNIHATEISRPLDTICIILVTWNPPANSDASDIDHYIVYVPSRDIRDITSSTLTNLTVINCGNDTRIQVAAVNRVGCVGMNSSEVKPILLDIPTAPATSEGGCASTSNQLSAGAVAGITIAVVLVIVCICIVIIVYIYCHFKKKIQNLTLESHHQSDELKEVD